MGFPSVCYCVILPKPLTLTIQLLDYIRLSILLSLSFLGLAAAPFEDHNPHPTSPSPIEARLRVVEFASLARRSAKGEEISNIVCAVCLGDLELEHEVRELGNCSHAFHKCCIDKWVEMGHATCPLCRALLWPVGWSREN